MENVTESALLSAAAYQYGNRDALTGIGLTVALDALSSANFGAQAQALRPFSGLQEGLVKLS